MKEKPQVQAYKPPVRKYKNALVSHRTRSVRVNKRNIKDSFKRDITSFI